MAYRDGIAGDVDRLHEKVDAAETRLGAVEEAVAASVAAASGATKRQRVINRERVAFCVFVTAAALFAPWACVHNCYQGATDKCARTCTGLGMQYGSDSPGCGDPAAAAAFCLCVRRDGSAVRFSRDYTVREAPSAIDSGARH